MRVPIAAVLLAVSLTGCGAPRSSASTPSTTPAQTAPWHMVAQFKGTEANPVTTKAFTTTGAWRLTWLTYGSLEVVVLQAKTTRQFGKVNERRPAGPPTSGEIKVEEPGDFFLVIKATGSYQIDVEEPRKQTS